MRFRIVVSERNHEPPNCHPNAKRGTCVKIIQFTIGISSLLIVALAVAAQTPPPDAGLTDNPIFQKNCAKCHGKTAEGRHFGGPSLVSEAAMAKPAEELREIITNGKHHMPKYAGKLTAEEINTLVDQIKSPPKK
jgi:mono/diheme cytochrome c family protein